MFNFIDAINKAHSPKNNEKLITFIDSSGTGGIPAHGDQEILNQVYENLEIVYRCIFMAANNIACLPKKVFRTDEKDNQVDVSDLFPLLQTPNDQQTEKDFWIESISRSLLQGELFWELLLGAQDIPQAMFADWRSEEIYIKTKDQIITGYKRNINSQMIEFATNEVFYIKTFNPYNKYRGLSALRAARHSIELDLDAINFNKQFFKQGMKLNGILQTEQELDLPVAERLRKEFEKVYGGINNMHKTAVLHSGLSFTALNDMSMSDAQFLELRTMNREDIAMAFGTPLEVLGIGKATFENEKYARRKYWTETLIPEIGRMEDMINRFLLPRLIPKAAPNIYKFKFITKDIEALKEDRSAKVKDYQIGISQRALSPNEMRVDVYDKKPWDDPSMDEPLTNPEPIIPEGSGEEPKHICGDDGIQQKKKFY